MLALLRSALRLLRLPAPRAKAPPPRLESLEARTLLSAATAAPGYTLLPSATAASAPYTPTQIRAAYGFNRLPYDGAGQTIAIVDAYDDPTILSDLRAFDRTFGLSDPPSFVKAIPQGKPPINADWGVEISLDVEWAHVVAPRANILLVEAMSASESDLLAAVDFARNRPGVAAVSMSWGGAEFSTESANDSTFTTPAGHGGVVFVAASGDYGKGAEWPAVSPNVLAVGGTSLTVTTQNTWGGETGWSGSGGGLSQFETEPAYQRAAQGSGKRATPDVAYDADPNTGYYVYDTSLTVNGHTGWFDVGGTSAGAPQWAALIALADQGRAASGVAPLANGPSVIYSLPAADFNDVTSGNNGLAAAVGYDMVTGRGSPVASAAVSDLVKYGQASPSGAKGGQTKSAAPAARHSAVVHAYGVVEWWTPGDVMWAEVRGEGSVWRP